MRHEWPAAGNTPKDRRYQAKKLRLQKPLGEKDGLIFYLESLPGGLIFFLNLPVELPDFWNVKFENGPSYLLCVLLGMFHCHSGSLLMLKVKEPCSHGAVRPSGL